MAGKEHPSQPKQGVTLLDAMRLYGSAEALHEWEMATERLRNHRMPSKEEIRDRTGEIPERVVRLKKRYREVHRQYERQLKCTREAVYREIQGKLLAGELIAWGARLSPTKERSQIHPHAWEFLVPKDLERSIVQGPAKETIYAVHIYPGSEGRQISLQTRVWHEWNELSATEQANIDRHGGRQRIAEKIAARIPQYRLPSIRRELTNIWRQEGRTRKRKT